MERSGAGRMRKWAVKMHACRIAPQVEKISQKNLNYSKKLTIWSCNGRSMAKIFEGESPRFLSAILSQGSHQSIMMMKETSILGANLHVWALLMILTVSSSPRVANHLSHLVSQSESQKSAIDIWKFQVSCRTAWKRVERRHKATSVFYQQSTHDVS